ncbi:hypothetical protein [Rossellomorea sp. y25]|uniref:hypothetical protein n=1 Tax=Rossellomorea sp. y25 TaxID=3118174 RepID=UPI0030E3AEA3
MYIYEIIEDLSSEEKNSTIEEDEFKLHKDYFITDQELNEIVESSKEIELERKHVKNLREQSAVLAQIIDENTETNYDITVRTKHEVYGGYKRAKERQKGILIDIKNIKVFNLYFRFKNSNTDALGTTAMMMRNSKSNEEIILLLPDNTKVTYHRERNFYINAANKLVFHNDYPMNPDDQSFLIENLNLLNVHERCTQSLLHEYGHILHFRIFDKLNFTLDSEVYQWFHDNGYTKLLNLRSPEFAGATDKDKIYLLKESIVEDYRIYLNMLEKNGMFILPNINTYQGDFRNPNLLIEGVRCMKSMFEEFIKQEKGMSDQNQSSTSQEPDRIKRGKEILETSEALDWYPGKNRMTEEDHDEVIKRLKQKEDKSFLELV